MKTIRSQLRDVRDQRRSRERKELKGGFEWTSYVGWIAIAALLAQAIRCIAGLNGAESPTAMALAAGLFLISATALVALAIRSPLARQLIPKIGILIFLFRAIWIYRSLAGQ